MDVEVLDRAKEQCTGTGTTGNLTLASVSYDGFNTFSDQLLDGVTVDVLVVDSDFPYDGWEVLRCSYTLATKVLNRSSGTVLASSNSGNAINLSASTHSVGIVNSALRIVENRDFVADHLHPQSDIVDLLSDLGNKADLVAGEIPVAQIPAIAITEYLGVVANETAMLLLTGERGDWCIRSDSGTNWVLVGEPSSAIGNWVELLQANIPVQSVNGETGVVVLDATDVGAAATSHTHALLDITDSGNSAALDTGTIAGTVATGDHGHTKADIGLGNVDNTSDADKPISTLQQSEFDDKEQAFTKNTGFNKDLGTISGTVSEGNHSHADLHTHANKALLDTYTQTEANLAATVAHKDIVTGNPHNVTLSDVGGAAASHTHADLHAHANKALLDTYDQTNADVTTAISHSGIVTGNPHNLDAADVGAAPTSHDHTLASIVDAGTAASYDVPAAGDAAANEVVLGDDTRLGAGTGTDSKDLKISVSDAASGFLGTKLVKSDGTALDVEDVGAGDLRVKLPAVIEESPEDNLAYGRRNTAWVHTPRMFVQATEPVEMEIGDFWVETA